MKVLHIRYWFSQLGTSVDSVRTPGTVRVRIRVRVRVGGGMRYLRTEKLRSFHLRPFIVLTITKRAHYKAESETACRVNVLKLVSPNQPD